MSAGRHALFTIAPHAPFLATLVDRILDGTLLQGWPQQGPFWLSDVTIVLPTRRARLALAQTFADRGHVLLPEIRTIGGEQQDEEPFLPAYGAPPPEGEHASTPVSPLERRLVLARLVDAWARTPGGQEVLATPPNASEIFGLADSLGGLIDDLAIEDVRYETLRTLPPEDLAANWQKILQFLDIALAYWPETLTQRGRIDAAQLRNGRLRQQAAAAAGLFGERPVIAAGSTGSIPATAAFLDALARLPRGAIVLPGLDNSLSPAEHELLLNQQGAPHGHPQYGLARLLRRLGSSPSEVVELAPEPLTPRTTLLRHALALADATSGWAEARLAMASDVQQAAMGISIIAARTADEEARAIALAAHNALTRHQTVGIVSPDQNLSRRIAAELDRFGVAVDDAAGTPLFQSPIGRLVRLLLAVAVNDCAPVDLIALLRNRGVTLGRTRAAIAQFTDRLELALLRGQRLRPGFAGLRLALATALEAQDGRGPRLQVTDGLEIATALETLEGALAPLLALIGADRLDAAVLAQALGDGIRQLTRTTDADVAPLPGLDAFNGWVDELAAREHDGPQFPPVALDGVLYALMQGVTVASAERRRDDIAIWGQLEARLQSPDVMILAGLNEDIWPQPADPGPWLSRGMRLAAGLEPPERRQGQAAHDFAMALGNAQVIVALAERLGTVPALPSRFVQRLEAFAGDAVTAEMHNRGRRWIVAARQLDAIAGMPQGARRPEPRPPASLRPRRLSVTEVETLFRSPYDLYAKYVLRLRRLPPLGEEPDARDRGTMIHKVFARFVEEGMPFDAPEAPQRLATLAAEAFAGLDAIGERRDIWLRRFELAASRFLEFEQERDDRVMARHPEIGGSWTFPALEHFTLKGRADRIDQLADGTLEILDFKTGAVPAKHAMQSFDAPQLLLEAAMARAGAMTTIAATKVSALTYVKIGLGPKAFEPSSFAPPDDMDLGAAADEISRRLQRHVSEFLLSDRHPMAARIVPVARNYRGDYDHLARTDEWTVQEGDDSE